MNDTYRKAQIAKLQAVIDGKIPGFNGKPPKFSPARLAKLHSAMKKWGGSK